MERDADSADAVLASTDGAQLAAQWGCSFVQVRSSFGSTADIDQLLSNKSNVEVAFEAAIREVLRLPRLAQRLIHRMITEVRNHLSPLQVLTTVAGSKTQIGTHQSGGRARTYNNVEVPF